MDINETLSQLRGSLAEGGLPAAIKALSDHFGGADLPTVVWKVHESNSAPLRDYLRAHVTAWDVFHYIVTALPKLFRDDTPYSQLGTYTDAGPLVFFDGELLLEGKEYTLEPTMYGTMQIRLHTHIPTDVNRQLAVIYATPDGFLRVEVNQYDYNSFTPP